MVGIFMDISWLKLKDNFDKVGKQFEVVFIGMMLKSMCQVKFVDLLFDLKVIDIFIEMQDIKVVQLMVEYILFGIGKVMIDFFS